MDEQPAENLGPEQIQLSGDPEADGELLSILPAEAAVDVAHEDDEPDEPAVPDTDVFDELDEPDETEDSSDAPADAEPAGDAAAGAADAGLVSDPDCDVDCDGIETLPSESLEEVAAYLAYQAACERAAEKLERLAVHFGVRGDNDHETLGLVCRAAGCGTDGDVVDVIEQVSRIVGF